MKNDTIKKIKRFSPVQVMLRWLLRIFLYGWGVLVVFPLLWAFYTSFKKSSEFIENVWKLPGSIYLVNYIKAWNEASMGTYFANTLFVVGLTAALFFIMVTTTSYILGKYEWRPLKYFRGFYFFAMTVPGILVLVPLYFQLESLIPNITDNLVTLALVYSVQSLPVPIFLLTGFVRSIDKSFIEAADIDGASQWRIFSSIILPFIRPIVAFLCLTSFMGTWNEYLTALTFLSNTKNYTISVGLQKMATKFGYVSDYGAVFAGMMLSLLPILILYILFQKQIQNGTDMSEGVK